MSNNTVLSINQNGITVQERSDITLTIEEAEALEDYLWCSFIPYIKDEETEVDNLEFLRLITSVWRKCKDALDAQRKADDYYHLADRKEVEDAQLG